MKWVRLVGEELDQADFGLAKKTLTLAFVSEESIKKLNHQWRKKNTATDILSFAPLEKNSLGELALCLPVIYKATPVDLSYQAWLCYLILHGILHLLGFEHEGSQDRASQMYQLQDEIFAKLCPTLDISCSI